MFKISIKSPDLKNLEKFYRKAPKQFARASAGMLNNLAFQGRTQALVQIAGDMNIRSDRFVNSRMQVDRARGRSISQQKAEFGSRPTARFSGWVEQETGKAPLRNRVFGIAARRGSERNVATGKARLKAGNKFFTPNDFDIKGNDADHRTVIFLQLMATEHANKPFVMRKQYRKMSKGIYVFSKRGKLRQLQDFKAMTVKRDPWMAPTRKRVLTRANVRSQWARSISHTLRR